MPQVKLTRDAPRGCAPEGGLAGQVFEVEDALAAYLVEMGRGELYTPPPPEPEPAAEPAPEPARRRKRGQPE